jgi:hypothetical protein
MSEKPWYMTPASVGNDPKLCQTCVHINFEWLLENDFNKARYAHWQASRFAAVEDDTIPIKIPWISEHASFVFPDLSLGFLFEVLEKAEHCSFCRLVSFAVATAYGTEPQSLLKQNFQHAPYQFVFCTLTTNKRDVLSGELYDLVIGLSNIQKGFHPFEQVLLHQIKDDAPTPFVGCSVGPYVNFRAIKDWLVSFGSSTPTREALPGFRLIDVFNRNVVPIVGPGNCRYLCLSYVWGGPQRFQNVKAIEQQLREPGSLSERQLPETIEDAIQLTAKSGERYLWVDSLCIIQDDGDAKMVQIKAMDQIYSCALATIVDSDGTNCYSGLPGVGGIPRHWKQFTADLRGIRLANKYQNIFASKQPLWNTRGWTFQEHALSRRCIHIGLGCIQFESEDGITNEDMHPPLHKPRPKWVPTGLPVGDSIQDLASISNIQLFALSILMYSPRALTYDTDAIHAFQGVLNIHRPRFRREFLYGMPSSELEMALLWQPASMLQRRADLNKEPFPFPSWSWVAWKGALLIPMDGPTRFTRLTWVDALDMTTEFTSDEWRGADVEQSATWEIVANRAVQLAPWYFEVEDPAARFAHPVSKDVPLAMEGRRFLRPDQHVLTFYALCADITSIPGNHSLQSPEDVNATAPEGTRSHTLQDRFNRFCGIVYLHCQTSTFNNDTLECIAISRTAYGSHNACREAPPADDSDVVSIRASYADREELRKKSDERDASNYFDSYDFELKWQAYDVLVIARGYDRVAERVGVGFCLCEAFWDAGPSRERVLLK